MYIFKGIHTEGMGLPVCCGSCLIIIVFCLHNIWGATLSTWCVLSRQTYPGSAYVAQQRPPPSGPQPPPRPHQHQMLQEPTPSSAATGGRLNSFTRFSGEGVGRERKRGRRAGFWEPI